MIADGAADRGGVLVADKVVAVNFTRLALGQKVVDLLPKGGYRAKVSIHVLRATSGVGTVESSSTRKRYRPNRDGMATLDGVRTGDIGRSHIQRLVAESEGRTERSL